ncbi:hypothetical protein IU459_12035 [Nocardia amamiensis]|uniref:HTH cro/C1-type domain-containing protein n=1 Tax=Nocardia amamiensis TaxID=404578 RepID=A0ABS0CPS9_9NOCA|nr:hypothetical protein [Nocardia amamiensis]MBF6298271.1 hypothetical protein [Nocardia amamiensis]
MNTEPVAIGGGGPRTIDAGPAREHLRQHAAGRSYRGLARMTGVDRRVIADVVQGRKDRIVPHVSARLLATPIGSEVSA